MRVLKKLFLKPLVKAASFVLSGLLIVILLWQYSQNRTVSLNYLDQQGLTHTLVVPFKDKERLAKLFEYLFASDNFAYVMLGSKPVAWQSYQNPLPFSNWTWFFDSFSKHNRTFRSGWETWEKYRHLFPSAHFFVENPKRHPGSISILLINEKNFNGVVNKNKRDFQEVLGREIVDGFQLLNEAKGRSLMDDVLEGHQALMGIVLGYGSKNSWQFNEGCKTRTAIGWVWNNDEEYFGVESEEYDINLTYYHLSHYSCPSFSGDPNSEESKALKTEYLLTKQKVMDYYKGKDFLEATLSLLAGYRPQSDSGGI